VLTVSYGPERPKNSKKRLEFNSFIVCNKTQSITAQKREKDGKKENIIFAEMYVLIYVFLLIYIFY
jgi:hypothetical protein